MSDKMKNPLNLYEEDWRFLMYSSALGVGYLLGHILAYLGVGL